MSPAFAIGGGTDDIHLNTLGQACPGLPRDPRATDGDQPCSTGGSGARRRETLDASSSWNSCGRAKDLTFYLLASKLRLNETETE